MKPTIIIQNRIYEDEESAAKAKAINIVVDDSSVELSRFGSDKGAVTVGKNEFSPWGGYTLMWSHRDGFVAMHDMSRNPYAMQQYRDLVMGDGAGLIDIGWGETADVMAVACYYPAYCASEYQHFERIASPTEFIAQAIPGYAEKRLKQLAARRELMLQMNPFDSIAALEKQVDLLSRLVFSLIATKGGSKLPDYASRYIDIVKTLGADAAKGAGASLDDIEELKRHVRDAQAKYQKARK